MPLNFLSQFFYRLFLKPFIKAIALPDPQHIKADEQYIFLLAKNYAADKVALRVCLKSLGIEQATIITCPKPQQKKAIANLQKQLSNDDGSVKKILAVNIFWGRQPRKVKNFWQAYLANTWAVAGLIKRIFLVLSQIRNVNCYFGQEQSISILDTQSIKHLQQLFNKQKALVIGPDLSHRRMLGNDVLQSAIVQECINTLANDEKQKKKLNLKAKKYLNEMAADYSYSVVRFFDVFLSWLWEKLYHGVEVSGMENIIDIGEDHEIVYVPCHRSHIDYLLLSYIIYSKGLMPPHIAAGINLNMPIVGSLLRRGGAFFIRRQFRDNKLYRAVLESYVATMCDQGFPLEYFIEGGRSRTGFLLPAKAGMLAMTLRAAQIKSTRPLAFIPVYIGYERLLESHSYINELYGEKKKSESISGLLSTGRYLKENYGKVFLNIGKPILEDDIWQQVGVKKNEKTSEGEAFFQCIDILGRTILTEINNAASLSPLNLIATAMLGSNRKALVKGELLQQMQLLKSLTQLPIYKNSIKLGTFNGEQAINYAESLNLLKHNAHALGDIYFLDQQAAVSATFLRNNSMHIFVMPALIASILINTQKASLKRIREVCTRVYPYLKAEFHLPWQQEQLVDVIEHSLSCFLNAGLITQNNQFYKVHNSESEQFHALMLLSGACKASIERFYITAQLISSNTAGYYNASELEEACVQMAERLSLLHEFHAPDFFDKNLFRTFITSLIKEQLLLEDENKKIHAHSAFISAKKLAKYGLSPSAKRSIKQITQQEL